MTGEKLIHFVSFNVAERRRLFDLEHPNRILLEVLRHQLEQFQATCVGYVVMPDHVHVLLGLGDALLLERFLHGWKRMSSFRIRKWYVDNAPQYFANFGMGDRFWQPRAYCFPIDHDEKVLEKLNYIHRNPVRAALVSQTTDWIWSSARWYESRADVGVPITWIE